MRLVQLFEDEKETVQNAPPPGELGEYITTAQAAKILRVSMSRVRQFIGEGRLKSYRPEDGRRDNMLKTSEVYAFKDKDRKRTGRPPEEHKSKKDKSDDSDKED